tara:strand:- start:4318 stop:5532 length:1215 start_codon:yes stop_codon:yes gene_type:complete
VFNLKKILVISNGNGEDISGCQIAKQLINLGHDVEALPIVGNGNIYKKNKINVIIKTKTFSTGGLGYNSIRGTILDILEGQIIYLIKILFLIFSRRKEYKFLITIGDILPVFLAWLIRKETFTYLVAYSSHYEGKLRLPWPCSYFLKSDKFKLVFARDLLTSLDLSSQLKRKVDFQGNPFMDELIISGVTNKSKLFTIGVLPGSRMPELARNISLIFRLLSSIPIEYNFFRGIVFDMALADSLDINQILYLVSKYRFIRIEKMTRDNVLIISISNLMINIRWSSFQEIMNNSDMFISMSGTAAEQAIGLSKPVLQLIGGGPQFNYKFAEAQRRLLGKYVFCAEYSALKEIYFNNTIGLLIDIIYRLKIDSSFLNNCRKNSSIRIGLPNKKSQVAKIISNSIYLS